jgi:hypothetical protein
MTSLRDKLEDVASDFKPAIRHSEEIVRISRRRGRRRRAGLVSLFAVGLVASIGTWVVVASSDSQSRVASSESQPRSDLGIVVPPPGQGPFLDGIKTTLEAVDRRANFPVFRPNDPLASDSSLTAVWFESETNQVALEYRSGIEIILQPESDRCPNCPDPRTGFEQRAAQFGPPVRVQVIHGVPALVFPSTIKTDVHRGIYVTGGPLSAVELILKGVHISVAGEVGLDDLIRVTTSLA